MEMTTTAQFVIHEEEMCQRLIQVSFAKIVNSKNERGGARLHKNLLILHLLQKARSEQRRSFSPPFAAKSPFEPQEEIPMVERQEKVDDDDDDENSASTETAESDTSLTDAVLEMLEEEQTVLETSGGAGMEEQKVVDASDIQKPGPYSFLGTPLLQFVEEEGEELGEDAREEPLFYPVTPSLKSQEEQGRGLNPFLDPEDETDEVDSSSSKPKVIVQSATEEFCVRFESEEEEEEEEEEEDQPKNLTRNKLSSSSSQSSGYDSGSTSGSGSSSSDDDEVGDSPSAKSHPSSSSSSSNPNRRKRKRRCSSTERPSINANNNANNNNNVCCATKSDDRSNKKCCTEMDNAQLSGLISVFNSGLASLHASSSPSPAPSSSSEAAEQKSDRLPCCNVTELDICGANGVPCRSISCPSFRELACES